MSNAGDFLTTLNLRLRTILERVDEPFVSTAFYLIVDATSKDVEFANAAHPVPVRLRRRENAAELITNDRAQSGPALGLFDDIAYATFSCPLEPNDCLILFTDGLYELMDAKGGRGSYDEFLAYLEAQTLHGKLTWEAMLHWLDRAQDT